MPETILTNSIFHELLHYIIIAQNFPGINDFSSPILKKYSNENPFVRAHIHLFALQYLVYKNLNRENDFFEGLRWLKIPEFERAWVIVQAEGINSIILELKI